MQLTQSQWASSNRGSQGHWGGRPRASRNGETWGAITECRRGRLGPAVAGRAPFIPLGLGHKAKERNTDGQMDKVRVLREDGQKKGRREDVEGRENGERKIKITQI